MSPARKDNLDHDPHDDAPSWSRAWSHQVRSHGGLLALALVFWFVAAGLLIAGRRYSGYHIRQYVTQPITARVDFAYRDRSKLITAQQRARELEPRVYRINPEFSWAKVQEDLKQLPDAIAAHSGADLPASLRGSFDSTALNLLTQYAAPDRRGLYQQRVEAFVNALRKLVVIPIERRDEEISRQTQWRSPSGFAIRAQELDGNFSPLTLDRVYANPPGASLNAEVSRVAVDCFRDDLAPQIAEYVKRGIKATHLYDEYATVEAQDRAGNLVAEREGDIRFKSGVVIKAVGEIDERDLGILQAEHMAYRESLENAYALRDYLGIGGLVAIITAFLGSYIRRYQPRIFRNHARATALGLLLLGMLTLSQLAAPGTRPLYVLGVAPTILTAIILGVAYDPRLAMSITGLLAILITLALNQDVSFLIVLLAGCGGASLINGAVRTRGRLIEIGLVAGIFMALALMFTGVGAFHGIRPFSYIIEDTVHVGLSGLGAGFIALGILPFIEKAFRITTGMTLLELSDASHPLQRRLAMEAPGTYNHSLQVATLAEAAAETIGANSLLTRVGALYHDIGKSKHSHFFCENQSHGGNAHLSLSPEVSFKIIAQHIKDGIDLAKEHNLPTALHPFIQQHHGTTLVEFFYHEACQLRKKQGDGTPLPDSTFRYPGPRPRSREVAIVMLADCCESAARTLEDATPDSVTKLVHAIAMRRLLDGQFSDCELTLHELELVEKTFVHTLQSIHHARIAYPTAPTVPAAATGS